MFGQFVVHAMSIISLLAAVMVLWHFKAIPFGMNIQGGSPAVNPILSNIALQYRNTNFIADQILPVHSVVQKTGRYQVYAKEDRFNIHPTKLGPKAEAREIEWKVGEATYTCEGNALKDFVSEEDEANAASPIQPQADTVELLQDLMEVAREKRVNDLLAANVPGANAGAKWNVANTDVIGDVLNAVQQCFAPANTVIMSKDVLFALEKNTAIMERIKYSQLGVLTTELLAKFFKVDRVLVGDSKYNTAKKGQNPTYAQIWTDNVYVCYINPRPTPKTLTLGLTFAQQIFSQGKWRVRSWREEKRGLGGGTMVQVENCIDERLMATDVAYAIKDVL